jgi:EmrB/QacA subfamily drug resistance transporter
MIAPFGLPGECRLYLCDAQRGLKSTATMQVLRQRPPQPGPGQPFAACHEGRRRGAAGASAMGVRVLSIRRELARRVRKRPESRAVSRVKESFMSPVDHIADPDALADPLAPAPIRDASPRRQAESSQKRVTSRAANLALMLLVMAQFAMIIDASIVNVALPSIGVALHFSRADLSWVVNAYTLSFAGFLLLGGRLADLAGRRRMFIVGLVLFTAASLAGGLAQSEGWLIAARTVQGLGAAIVSPAALSILTTTFSEGAERNRALAIWSSVGGAATAVGVLLGGVLTTGLGWEWVLFVNVPIGFACVTLAPRLLGESRNDTGGRSFDVLGAMAITAGLALLVYAFVDAVNVGWGSSQTLLKIAGAAVLLILFVVIELRSSAPLMPFSIFRLRTLRGANVVALLIGASLFSMFFFISLYLQDVLGKSPIQTGLCFLPLAFGIIFASGAAAQLVNRVGFKAPLIIGLLITSGGLAWFSRAPVHGSFLADILGPELLVAAGLGFAFVSVTIAALTGTQPREAGLASGLINTTQWIGGALGLAVLATVADSRIQHLLHSGVHRLSVALTSGYDHAFLGGAAIAFFGALLAAVLISSRDSRTHAQWAAAAAKQ